MNEIAQQNGGLALADGEAIAILQSSLYPGAAIESVKMVLGYCRAAGLDPFQKPVHIVPMFDRNTRQMRDVVMPGIGLYRTQASRTGTFAGQSEPEFGPMVSQKLGTAEITYPEWAKVTVKKMMANGSIAEFTAVEYWIENYAVKGGAEKSIAPNAMWTKRPRGQIAKCAAAQALRLAFPEMGAQPTAEEMEGKTLQDDMQTNVQATGEVASPELTKEADTAAAAGEATYQAFWGATGKDNRRLLGAGHESRKATALAADRSRTVENEVPAIKSNSKVKDKAPPELTFAAVMDRLVKAKDVDALSIAADLIGEIPDAAQRAELVAKFDALSAEMQGTAS